MNPHRTGRILRRLFGRVFVPAAAVLLLVLARPSPASAHPTLLFTTPAVDTADPQSPDAIVLVFNEAVTLGPQPLVVLDASGGQIPVEQVSLAQGATTVTGHVARTLAPGVYTLRWRVTGTDGDLVESTFRFAIGVPIAASSTSDGGDAGTSWPPVPLRWLLFTGFALVLGGAVGRRITNSARAVRAGLPPVPDATRPAAAAGLAATIGLGVLLAADVGLAAWTGSTPGRVLLVEAAAFTAALVLGTTRWRRWAWLAVLAVPLAEGVRSHTAQAAPAWGATVTVVHLAAAGVWVGALIHVVGAAIRWRSHKAALRWIITGYARWAVWAFNAVVASGLLAALILVPLSSLTTTGYGRLLLVKIALVTLAAAAALIARAGLRRDATLPRTTRATRVEAATLTGVLVVTAMLVSTPTARDSTPLAPPPATGTVLPLATLAGQVGVAAEVSDGQLVARLSAPKLGDYYQTGPAQRFGLTAKVLSGGSQTDIGLHGCGHGCYTGPVDWRNGDNVISLAVNAEGWTGATVSLLAPWPVTPAADRLTRVADTLSTAGTVTVYEQVTSDTSRGPGDPVAIHMDGKEFLATEPFSTGVAPLVVQTTIGTGTTTLALGFPADGRYVQMLIDDQDRIIAETVVDAKHVTRRSFVYPGTDE